MAMTGSSALWVWLAIIGAAIGIYYLYKQGKIPWLADVLKSIKLPKWFEPKTDTRIETLIEQTSREWAKRTELLRMLEAKTELAKARAENLRLVRQIDGVSEKSVEKDKQAEKKAQDAEIEAKKVKPRRL